jgi:putative transcriptional regulator
MTTPIINDLNHHLLVAMPNIRDEPFAKAVLFVHEFDKEGAMAFIVNKPMPLSIGDILRQLKLDIVEPTANHIHLLQGGPVSNEQLYIVQYNTQRKTNEKMALIQPQELLQAFAQGQCLENILPFLGYSGWQAGQLDKEIRHNDWLICPPSREILFDTPPKKRYQACLNRLGISPDTLTTRGGNA